MDVSKQIFAGSAAILKVVRTERVAGKSIYWERSRVGWGASFWSEFPRQMLLICMQMEKGGLGFFLLILFHRIWLSLEHVLFPQAQSSPYLASPIKLCSQEPMKGKNIFPWQRNLSDNGAAREKEFRWMRLPIWLLLAGEVSSDINDFVTPSPIRIGVRKWERFLHGSLLNLLPSAPLERCRSHKTV